jgi:DNA-binding NarL/FixJ family response regulator
MAEALESLSKRERQIMLLAARGLTDSGIAQKLEISAATVGTYWGRIRTKLGHHSRTELVANYMREKASATLDEMRKLNEALQAELELKSKTADQARGKAEMLRRVLPPNMQLEVSPVLPDITLEFDHDAIQQALLNLALNARDAMGAHGRLTITVHGRQTEDGPWQVLEVRDNGPGMPPEVLGRATEPFFTTKAAHEGTGLGLAIVHRCMAQHNGRLVLDSEEGIGTTAALWFPSTLRGSDVIRRERVPTTPPTGIRRSERYDLLVIDDEPEIRSVTERALRRLGHRVTSVGDITAAMAWLETAPKVDGIVSDVMMPGGTGIEFVHLLRSTGRTTPVLLVSGFALEVLDDVLSGDHTVAFLPKPWALDALMSGIEGIIHSDKPDQPTVG